MDMVLGATYIEGTTYVIYCRRSALAMALHPILPTTDSSLSDRNMLLELPTKQSDKYCIILSLKSFLASPSVLPSSSSLGLGYGALGPGYGASSSSTIARLTVVPFFLIFKAFMIVLDFDIKTLEIFTAFSILFSFSNSSGLSCLMLCFSVPHSDTRANPPGGLNLHAAARCWTSRPRKGSAILLSSLKSFTSHCNVRPAVHTSADNKNSVNLHTFQECDNSKAFSSCKAVEILTFSSSLTSYSS
mmetsp:Transcript_17286/g.16625  ORF Transcript_17286/g.16625 Transcript_17286/m.16625 type:complete len:245 (-) Transcript_17286:44-778(-)